jgi:cation diffusion facilitator CzcD-associated flavoprotein CzcO
MSGLCMGIALKKAGFTAFTIVERASSIGGTWWENTYPGAQCDVHSHIYSYSFEPNPDWTEAFASQAEIQAYMERCARKYDLTRHIRLSTEIIEARFDADQGLWKLQTQDGDSIEAEIFVASAGLLSIPQYPDISGLETFNGKIFHSAHWDHNYDFAGKRVAVIGNASSAVQFIPKIAPLTKQLFVFQRSPHWIIPRSDHIYAKWEKALLRIPPIGRLYRWLLYWRQESNRLGFNPGSLAAKYITRVAEKHLRKQIPDEKLRSALRPTYPIGCKRILISNEYYPTLIRPNVELVTSPIDKVSDASIISNDGEMRAVDAIICATGFNAMRILSNIRIEGLGGVSLAEVWKAAPHAYHGVTVAGFPNFFLLLGPNTGSGHTSTLIFIEAQVQYVIGCIRELMKRRQTLMTIAPDAMRRQNGELQASLTKSVWATGCTSWYKTSEGNVAVIYPGFSFQYVQALRHPKFEDYLFV